MFVLGVTSCTTPKDVAYLQDLNQGIYSFNGDMDGLIKIMPGDRLTIIVSSKDPELSNLFTLTSTQRALHMTNAQTAVTYNAGNSELAQYTVDPQGNIDFPVIGEIHVEGLTRPQVAELIKDLLIKRDLIKEPTVTVDLTNVAVNVIGAVNKPGRYLLDHDRTTILEAIASAGDLNIQGQRSNVAVLRELEPGRVEVYRIDLTSAESLYNSPAYYLRQNDVIVVEPTDSLKRQRNGSGNTFLTPTFWVSVASLLTTITVLVVNK